MGNPAVGGLWVLIALFVVGALWIARHGGDPNVLVGIFKPILVIGVFVALAISAVGAAGR